MLHLPDYPAPLQKIVHQFSLEELFTSTLKALTLLVK
jgi:hypothetical protein